jgi:hypothetical protein
MAACIVRHAKQRTTTHGSAEPDVANQPSILRRHAALIEGLYADNPADHVVCLDRVSEERI